MREWGAGGRRPQLDLVRCGRTLDPARTEWRRRRGRPRAPGWLADGGDRDGMWFRASFAASSGAGVVTGLRARTIVLAGVALGVVFSAWNVLASLLDPLADDTV